MTSPPRGLAAVEVFDARAGDMQDEDDRLVAADALLLEEQCRGSGRSRRAARNGLTMPGDQLTPVISRRLRPAPRRRASRRRFRTTIRDPVVVVHRRPCDSRSCPSRQPASREARLEVVAADDAEQRRLDRLGVRLHRVEQRAQRRLVDGVVRGSGSTAARAPGRSPRAPAFCFAVPERPRNSRDELAHGARPPALGVVRRRRRRPAAQPLRRVPVRRGRIRGLPLAPAGVRRRVVADARRTSRRTGSGAG